MYIKTIKFSVVENHKSKPSPLMLAKKFHVNGERTIQNWVAQAKLGKLGTLKEVLKDDLVILDQFKRGLEAVGVSDCSVELTSIEEKIQQRIRGLNE